MRGRAHLLLSLLSLLVITLPFWSDLSGPVWLCVYAGILTGSLAPDVDAPDSMIFHLRMPPRGLSVLLSLFGYLVKYLVYLPLSFFFWIVSSRNYRHEHRGFLHTPIGFSLAALLVLGYALLFSLLVFHSYHTFLLWFIGSFWAGGILHLVQDSCTPSGIAWGFPLHQRRLRGTIRTGSRWDPRPALYAAILLGCLGILSLLSVRLFPLSGLIAILVLISAWALFLYLARTSREQPNVY
jgi:Predicted membrane-bound metal-dependent hydrolase (DUF457).